MAINPFKAPQSDNDQPIPLSMVIASRLAIVAACGFVAWLLDKFVFRSQ
jgi:hypothetical protein